MDVFVSLLLTGLTHKKVSTQFDAHEEGLELTAIKIEVPLRRGEQLVALLQRICTSYIRRQGDGVDLSIIHGKIDSVRVTCHPAQRIVYLHSTYESSYHEIDAKPLPQLPPVTITPSELQLVKLDAVVKPEPGEDCDSLLDRVERLWNFKDGDEVSVEYAYGVPILATAFLYSYATVSPECLQMHREHNRHKLQSSYTE